MRKSILFTVLFLAFSGTARAQQQFSVEAQAKLISAHAAYVTAQAAYIAAQAGANKTNAEALQTTEQAKGLALDNNLKKAEVFYNKKALYQNHKNLVRDPRKKDSEDYLRISKASLPQRLNEEHFDSLRGAIVWTSLLMREEFDTERDQLNELFEKRLDYPQDVSQDVKLAVKKMEGMLLLMVKESDQTDYAKAKRFLRSLAYESQFQTTVVTGRLASY